MIDPALYLIISNSKQMTSAIKYLLFFQLACWLILIGVDYYSIEYNNYDTGIFANLVARLLQEGRYYSSILDTHGLADHFSPNVMLLAPLFKIYPTFLWLPVLKVIALFACIPVLYALCNDILGKQNRYAQLVVFFWLINMYLGRTLYFEFQPSALALPFILLSFLYALRKNYKLLLVYLIFLLGFKEQMALIWLSVGTFLIIFEKKRTAGALLIISGIVIGLTIVTGVMPHFNQSEAYQHLNKLGPLSLLPEKFLMLITALSSVLFIPLFKPATLLFILPAFFLSLLSGESVMATLAFHYQDIGLTVMFVGLIYGLKAIQDLPSGKSQMYVHKFIGSALFIIICLAINNRQPVGYILKHWPKNEDKVLVERVNTLKSSLAEYPDTDSIWVIDSLGPYLFQSTNLKSIVNFELIKHLSVQKMLIAFSPDINTYPLVREQVFDLDRQLQQSGKVIQLKEYLPLIVYRSVSENN